MVPAESILNLESMPLFLTISLNTPSAAGLLQMLPKHTNKTEKGLVVAAEEAIDAFIKHPDEETLMGL